MAEKPKFDFSSAIDENGFREGLQQEKEKIVNFCKNFPPEFSDHIDDTIDAFSLQKVNEIFMLEVEGTFSDFLNKAYKLFSKWYYSKDAELPCRMNVLDQELQRMSEFCGVVTGLSRMYLPSGMILDPVMMKDPLINAIKYSNIDKPVLIKGESGTGKTYIAKFIHLANEFRYGDDTIGNQLIKASKNTNNNDPFINFRSINAAHFDNPDRLISELFGHIKGAYTGATGNRAGLVKTLVKGTLFIDEIDKASKSTQGALLHFIEEKRFRPLGSDDLDEVSTECRLIFAANSNLELAVAEGRFLHDLYARIDDFSIELSPFNNHNKYLFLLLYAMQKGISLPELDVFGDALDLIDMYDWPLNHREFIGYLDRAFVTNDWLGAMERKIEKRKSSTAKVLAPEINRSPLLFDDFYKEYLQSAFTKSNGVRKEMERLTGIEYRKLARALKKYNIH